jgi:hypothetical protein
MHYPFLVQTFFVFFAHAVMDERHPKVARPEESLHTHKLDAETTRISQTDLIRQRYQGSTSICSLHVLPPELRVAIYEQCLKLDYVVGWNKRDPPHPPGLIQALRPDKDLYDEALAVYYQNNSFELNQHNFCTFRTETSFWVLEHVKALNLNVV